MKITSFLLNITSENPELVTAFYRDVVGLEPQPEMGEGALKISDTATLHIDGHSDTHGMTKEPQRVMIDFFVDSEETERALLREKGVQFIREAGVEWWGGVISTFADPDGNLCQIIEYDESRATANPDEVTAPA